MSIYRGNNKIASIYRGDNKIARVYRGNNLVYSNSKNRVLLFVSGSTRVYKAKYVNSPTYKQVGFPVSPITNPELRRYEFTYDSSRGDFLTFFTQSYITKITSLFMKLGNTSNSFNFRDLRPSLHNVVIDKTKLYVDGNYQQDLVIGNEVDYGTSLAINLGTYDFYEFKIYESGTLLYHFVPCYILVNGKEQYGIAELVSKTYSHSADFNGEPVYGELPEYLVRQAYVKCRDDLPYVMITTTKQYAFDTRNDITEFKVGMVRGVAGGNMVFSYAGVTFGASSNKNKYYYRCFTSQTEMGNFYDHEVATYRIEPRAFYKNSEFVSYLNDIRVSSEAQISFYFFKDQPLYYYKKSNVNELIANFIPVYNILTNQYGLYDLVKGVGIYHDDLRGRAMLPSEYQEVEFLESSGTQYIDADLKGNLNTKVFLDFQYLTNTAGSNMFFGSRNVATGEPNGSFIVGVSTSNAFYGQFDTVQPTILQPINADTLRHTTTMDKNGWYLDNVLYRTFENPIDFQTIDNLLIFTGHNGDKPLVLLNFRLYSSQIYNISVLVRNFVPCHRKGDNVAGLYDLANGIFYTNAGTGTFIVGGDI